MSFMKKSPHILALMVSAILMLTACAPPIETPAIAETPQADELRAPEIAGEAGVQSEVTPEEISLTAERPGLVALVVNGELGEAALHRLPVGERRTFPRGSWIEVFKPSIFYPIDCEPGKCPTPEPPPMAPLRSFWEPQSPVSCICPPEPCDTLKPDSSCYSVCCKPTQTDPEPVPPPTPES